MTQVPAEKDNSTKLLFNNTVTGQLEWESTMLSALFRQKAAESTSISIYDLAMYILFQFYLTSSANMRVKKKKKRKKNMVIIDFPKNSCGFDLSGKHSSKLLEELYKTLKRKCHHLPVFLTFTAYETNKCMHTESPVSEEHMRTYT